jgi:hypothetical protein
MTSAGTSSPPATTITARGCTDAAPSAGITQVTWARPRKMENNPANREVSSKLVPAKYRLSGRFGDQEGCQEPRGLTTALRSRPLARPPFAGITRSRFDGRERMSSPLSPVLRAPVCGSRTLVGSQHESVNIAAHLQPNGTWWASRRHIRTHFRIAVYGRRYVSSSSGTARRISFSMLRPRPSTVTSWLSSRCRSGSR